MVIILSNGYYIFLSSLSSFTALFLHKTIAFFYKGPFGRSPHLFARIIAHNPLAHFAPLHLLRLLAHSVHGLAYSLPYGMIEINEYEFTL